MGLLFFWLKIAGKRIIELVKISPVVTIGGAIIIAAFIIGKKNTVIPLGNHLFITIGAVLFCLSLYISAEKYDAVSLLILYSKSNNSNSIITIKYCMLRAFLNNIFLLFFNLSAFSGILQTEFSVTVLSVYVPVFSIFSIVCSFCCMYIKNSMYVEKKKKIEKIEKIKKKKDKKDIKIDIRIKCAVYDYCTAGFIQGTLISIAFFVIVVLERIKNTNLLQEMNYPSLFFIYLLIPLALGFMGIIDAVPHTNWKLYAVVSPKSFNYHFKRTLFFTAAVFGLCILSFVFIAASFDIRLLLKYFFSLTVLLFFPITIAYSADSMLTKAVGGIAFTAAALWISTVHPYFSAVLLIPLGYTLGRAKNDFRDWYLL